MAKEKYFYESERDQSEKSIFVASNSWVNNFMNCNGFSLRYKTTTAQQDPQRLIDKFILYILHGVKSVCLKTNGNEKCMVSVCLAAKADGTKLKSFVFFPCNQKRI